MTFFFHVCLPFLGLGGTNGFGLKLPANLCFQQTVMNAAGGMLNELAA